MPANRLLVPALMMFAAIAAAGAAGAAGTEAHRSYEFGIAGHLGLFAEAPDPTGVTDDGRVNLGGVTFRAGDADVVPGASAVRVVLDDEALASVHAFLCVDTAAQACAVEAHFDDDTGPLALPPGWTAIVVRLFVATTGHATAAFPG